MKRVRRTGRIFSVHNGSSGGKPRAFIDVQISDGPDAGRLMLVEMKASHLARHIASLTETLDHMRESASHKTAIMTGDREIHGCGRDGRPLCERPAKFLGPAFFTPKRITCALCLDVILNN